MDKITYVVIGTPMYRAGASAIDKFLENQRDIQRNFPSSELVLSTEQEDFIEELKGMLNLWGIRGKVISFQLTGKPDYVRGRVWNVALSREAIRRYTLTQTEASHLLFIDGDITCDPSVVRIMEREGQDYDMVFSAYRARDYALTLGLGCSLFSRHALEKVTFRGYEFKNHNELDEGEVFDMDLFRSGLRRKNGVFLAINHYGDDGDPRHLEPQPLSLLRRISNSTFARYVLGKASILTRHNIPIALRKLYTSPH